MAEYSEEIGQYFISIEEDLKKAYSCANAARAKGLDPETRVDIPLAKNMAERVENLIAAVAPQIVGSGVSDRIQELEEKYGRLAWQVALIIAEEVAAEKFCKFKDKREAMEVGIRTGFAYHTIGVVSAPLEGFVELRIKKRKDGKDYLAAAFAGPVRGAGGTATAVSILIADYVRLKSGYEAYDPDENEINRFYTELEDYHERVTNLQYRPSRQEVEYLVRHIAVEVDGDPTEELEVSNYKDLPRVKNNRIRGGVCLVVSMIALKAPKVWKEVQKWGKEFGLEWGFLAEFLTIQKQAKSKSEKKAESKDKIAPDFTYIVDLVAGRPVLTHPLKHGGFRLRYGRSRVSGYSAVSIHPLTMAVLNKYLAIGTQLKMERPGKAAAISVCDSIEGPIVKLRDGQVMRLEEQDKRTIAEVEEILYLGDMLISYGDFFDRAHPLAPAGYCEEWWVQEFEKAIIARYGQLDLEKASQLTGLSVDELDALRLNPFAVKPSGNAALKLSSSLNIPIHPHFSYHWGALTNEQLSRLCRWLRSAVVRDEYAKIILPNSDAKRCLELIGLPHSIVANEYVVIEKDDAVVFAATLNNLNAASLAELETSNSTDSPLKLISSISAFTLRDKSGTFIGARMGRPEKAKMRKLTGSPEVLFPVGEDGGRMRSFQEALTKGTVTADFPVFLCPNCKRQTIYPSCEDCGSKTIKTYTCPICGIIDKRCTHPEAKAHREQTIDLKHYFDSALKKMEIDVYPELIKGVRGTSNKDHVLEHLGKGILRSMHDIAVNKDGTVRYDMTELPITHFKPKEVRTSVERLNELGYVHDIFGKPLTDRNQILELKPQDIILPSSPDSTDETADVVLFRVAQFIDDMLQRLYKLEPHYCLKTKEELTGHLVIGIAPHISAGIIGRIIGFSQSQAFLAHPMFHAAMRRDADGDEACVIMLMDGLLNFSRQYLPDSRGSRTMDSPLVLTATIIPAEVDDMAHRIDVAWKYPLELYEAALEYKMPWEVKIEQLGSRLNTELQYERMGFTHPVEDINNGVTCSAYKTLPSMEEKLKGQMELADRIRAVDEADVARLVIEKHFLKDIKGNLRKFSTQQFRCVKCNKKFRRPPLIGRCDCKGKIIFTVSEGSIVKYLQPAISLAQKYKASPYLKQTLELTKRRVEEVFGKDPEKQEGLGKWFG